jgi:hypothetical protein
LHFVDNDGFADAFYGFSDVLAIRRMLMIYVVQEAAKGFASWISRVASLANPADGPSRLEGVPFDGSLVVWTGA